MRRQIERRPDGDGEVQLSGIHTVHELQGDARHKMEAAIGIT